MMKMVITEPIRFFATQWHSSPTNLRHVESSRTMTEVDIALRAIQLYSEMHPRPTHLTQVQAAEMLGVHRNTISKLLRAGVLRLNQCGLIPIELIDLARSTKLPPLDC